MKKLVFLLSLILALTFELKSQDIKPDSTAIYIKVHKGNLEAFIKMIDLSTERHDVVKFFIEDIINQINEYNKGQSKKSIDTSGSKPTNTGAVNSPTVEGSKENSIPVENKPEGLKPKEDKPKN